MFHLQAPRNANLNSFFFVPDDDPDDSSSGSSEMDMETSDQKVLVEVDDMVDDMVDNMVNKNNNNTTQCKWGSTCFYFQCKG